MHSLCTTSLVVDVQYSLSLLNIVAANYERPEDKPTLRQLQSMRSKDGKEIRTIDETAYKYHQVAVALDFAPHTIGLLERNHPGNAMQGCYDMFATWVDRRIDVTWKALVGALREADFGVLAHRIEAATIP